MPVEVAAAAEGGGEGGGAGGGAGGGRRVRRATGAPREEGEEEEEAEELSLPPGSVAWVLEPARGRGHFAARAEIRRDSPRLAESRREGGPSRCTSRARRWRVGSRRSGPLLTLTLTITTNPNPNH